MILKLENTTTHQTYEYEVKDMNNGEKLYFRFDIDTSNLVDGEYTLKLYDGEKVVANDLLKIGDYNPSTLQYKKGENIYIEVKLDESVQDVKNISISTIETTVLPDDGFNSMGKVDVNAQPLYDNAYHIGHTEGYNEGLESSYQVGYDDGYSVGNEEGYNSGYNVGNEDGFNNGVATQKNKLEAITITKNGTYTKEDGYNSIQVNVPDLNGSYDEGYSDGYLMGEDKGYDKGYTDGIEEGTSNAGSIIAETARVLEITENGVYKSKYSDKDLITTITGKYPNGDNFFDYSYISNRGYNTGIFPTPTTRIEFWWKYDGTKESIESVIVGAQKWGAVGSIYKVAHNYGDGFVASINDKPINFNIVDNEWHHITMSYADGFFIDGEKIGVFSENLPETSTYEPICINGYYGNSRSNADYYGMVIIDDTIFIPTAEGFLNTTTNEYLPIVSNYNGSYTFTEVEPEYKEPTGNLIKTVNVNVIPKINVWDNGIRFGESRFDYIPKGFDFSGKPTSLEGLFRNCNNLLELPYIDTSEVTNYSEWLLFTLKITNIPFEIIFNENANCTKMFYNSSLNEIPFFVTSNVTNIHYMFGNAKNIKTLPPFDFSKVTNYQYWIEGCTNLESLPYYDFTNVTTNNQYLVGFGGTLTKLTEIGGFALKQSCNGTYGLVKMPNLSYQSCINQLNALYDFTGNGETPNSSQGQLKVHQNFLTTVGDEISIGTNKGWVITT